MLPLTLLPFCPSAGAVHHVLCHLEIHRGCSNSKLEQVGQSFSTLLSISDDWNALPETSEAVLQLCDLMYYYASESYGRNAIKMWMKNHQDKCVPDKLSPSDLAFALAVFENYHPKWVAEIKAERGEDDEEDLDIKEPAKKKMKKASSAGMTLLYTKDPSKGRNAYLSCGWTQKGLRRFQTLDKLFRNLKGNTAVWDSCKVSFESYIDLKKNDDVDGCWVPTYHKKEEDDYDEENSSGEEEGFEFEIGGSEGVEAMCGGIMVPGVGVDP